MITSTNEFHQVMPSSLFHCASNVPQTKRRRASRVILTHSNIAEKAHQVMRDIARNVSPNAPSPHPPIPHPPIPPYPYRPIDQHWISGREAMLRSACFALTNGTTTPYNNIA